MARAKKSVRALDIATVLDTIDRFNQRFDDPPSVDGVGGETGDPFLVLVGTILSLRTREEQTRVAMAKLFAHARTPQQLFALTEHQVHALIANVGFARTKARTLRALCDTLITHHNARVPDTMDGLLALKGVGRKTANLVLTVGHRLPGICVDIHVHRICNRLGYVHTKNPDQTETALRASLPAKYWTPINAMLVIFGRNQCTPTSPRCSTCPVHAQCARNGVTRSR